MIHPSETIISDKKIKAIMKDFIETDNEELKAVGPLRGHIVGQLIHVHTQVYQFEESGLIDPRKYLLFSLFLERTRALCITVFVYEYVEGAPPAVVVVRHRKTLDSRRMNMLSASQVRGPK